MRSLIPFFLLLAMSFLWFTSYPAHSQTPFPKFEMRGVWVATVVNLDWPVRGASPADQQQALRAMFDRLHYAGMNAVFFQVRSESDAMYPSTLEPWSYYLTGVQGLPPAPVWDPLAFAIEEAHARGMELHAWINPYRVIRSVGATYPKALNHLSIQKPAWMLQVKQVLLLNPGIPEARQYLVNTLLELVKNYDLDGLHYDDYFYPYEGITNEDQNTYAVYGTGLPLDAWRTQNINLFVQELGDAVHQLKPRIKYGISPFGIWRSGVPTGIIGLSGASVTYGDAVRWLQEGWIDYLSPQLYWPFGGNQDFAKLALWWKDQMNGRHLYPGIAAYRAEPSMTAPSSLYQPDQIPRQLRFLRENQIPGALFFRAANLSTTSTQGLTDSLHQYLYPFPALTPTMPWKDTQPPAMPENVQLYLESSGRRLEWAAPTPQPDQVPPRFFAVYSVAASDFPTWATAVQHPENLLAITAENQYLDTRTNRNAPYWYAVCAVSSNSVESTPATPDAPTATRPLFRANTRITHIFPNPFQDEVHIQYRLAKATPVTLRILDLQGQEVARIIDQVVQYAGDYTASWFPSFGQAKQVYVVVLETNEKRVAKKIIYQ